MNSSSVRSFAKRVKSKYGLEEFSLYVDQEGNIELYQIVVPEEDRGAGKGKMAMRDLVNFADSTDSLIWLSLANPQSDGWARKVGASRGKLKSFYEDFGFVMNRGKNKRYELSMNASMYRVPRGRHGRQNEAVKEEEPVTKDGKTLSDLAKEIKKYDPKIGREVEKILSPYLGEKVLKFDPNRIPLRRYTQDIPTSDRTQLEIMGAIWGMLFVLTVSSYWKRRLGRAVWSKLVDKVKEMYRKKFGKNESLRENGDFKRALEEGALKSAIEDFQEAVARLREHAKVIDKIPTFRSLAKRIWDFLSFFPENKVRRRGSSTQKLPIPKRIPDIIRLVGIVAFTTNLMLKDRNWTGRSINLMMEFLGIKERPKEFDLAHGIYIVTSALKEIHRGAQFLYKLVNRAETDIDWDEWE